MSDTSDTSIIDSPPPAKRRTVRRSSVPTEARPKSIKKSHFLAALGNLKENLQNSSLDVDPLQDDFRSKEQLINFRRCCSLDLSIHSTCTWSVQHTTSKARLLLYSLTNSIFRRDWSTAAQCLQLMVDMERCCSYVYRTLLLVLFNHPAADSETINDFLTRVVNLRTRSDQLAFLRQTFLLPDDIDEFSKQEHVLSAKSLDDVTSEDEYGMTTSEDEQ